MTVRQIYYTTQALHVGENGPAPLLLRTAANVYLAATRGSLISLWVGGWTNRAPLWRRDGGVLTALCMSLIVILRRLIIQEEPALPAVAWFVPLPEAAPCREPGV